MSPLSLRLTAAFLCNWESPLSRGLVSPNAAGWKPRIPLAFIVAEEDVLGSPFMHHPLLLLHTGPTHNSNLASELTSRTERDWKKLKGEAEKQLEKTQKKFKTPRTTVCFFEVSEIFEFSANSSNSDSYVRPWKYRVPARADSATAPLYGPTSGF